MVINAHTSPSSRKWGLLVILFCILLICTSFVSAVCDDRDYHCQIQELKKENEKLEKQVSTLAACSPNDYNCRLTQLEQKDAALEEEINNIYFNLDFIYEIFDFIICDQMNLCGEQIACFEDLECGTNEESEPFCDDNDDVSIEITQNICQNAGTVDSLCDIEMDTQLVEDCQYGCEDAECLPPPEEEQVVVFRTSIADGDYYNTLSNAWIAVDRDHDGSLEGYGLRARSSWSNSRCFAQDACGSGIYPCVLVMTPTTDKVIDYNNVDMVVVCDEKSHKQVYYKLGDSDADDAELASEPTEPYSSNEREMLGDGSLPPSPQSNAWSPLAGLPVVMGNLVAENIDGKIYAGIGGSNQGSGRFFSYNPQSNTWTELAKHSEIYNRASAEYHGNLYAFGGVEHAGPLSNAASYDPSTNAWASIPSMPQMSTLQEGNAALVNGKIYVMGGAPTFGPNAGTNANQVYNIQTNTWETKSPMPRNRQLHAIAAVGNKIYVFSGQDKSGAAPNEIVTYDVIDVYDTTTNSWNTLSVKTPRKLASPAIAVIGSNIYLIGGKDFGLNAMSNKVYAFDTQTKTFEEKTQMPTARQGPAAAVHNGLIYVVGGNDDFVNLNTFEVYNPTLD